MISPFVRGENYGTIVCDLKTHRPIALLNGRDQSIVTDWLKEQPKVYIVARDGSNTYKAAITSISPDIVQVSDWFHLVQNLSKTTKEALTRLLPSYIEEIEGPIEKSQSIQPIVDSPPLSKKEEERWALVQEIKQAHQSGSSQRAIARSFQMSRNTVKKYIELEKPMVYYREASVSKIIQPFYELITERTISGSTAISIYQELKTLGFKDSYSIVQRIVRQLKSKQPPSESLLQQIPRKKVIYYFWKPHECLSDNQKRVLDIALNEYPMTQPIYGFVQLFREVFSTLNLEKYPS